jgi:DNA repair protein RadD
MSNFKLRSYQVDGIQACVNVLTSSKKTKELVVIPTAGGKSWYISKSVEQINVPTLVLQPSKELLKQNYSKFILSGGRASVCCTSLKIRIRKGKQYTEINGAEVRCDEIGKVTYATIGSVMKHIEKFKKLNLKHIIIDEAHLMSKSGSQMSKFIKAVGATHVLGLTATPIYLAGGLNGAALKMMNRVRGKLFSKINFVTQINELVESKYWSPLKYTVFETDESYLKENSNKSDFTIESQRLYYEANDLDGQIKEEINNLTKEGRKSILVFVPTIGDAERLCRSIPNSAVVHSELDAKTRDYVVDAFKDLTIPVVINVNILSTGFDHPELDAIITARPTSSIALYYQQIGRGVRIHPKKDNCKIIDFSGNVNRFGRVEEITFEDVPGYGWGMFGKDGVLLTDYPISAKRRPTKESLLKKHADLHGEDNSVKMWFGKYKDKTVKQIVRINKGYAAWLIDQKDWNWSSGKMKALKKSLEKELRL